MLNEGPVTFSSVCTSSDKAEVDDKILVFGCLRLIVIEIELTSVLHCSAAQNELIC